MTQTTSGLLIACIYLLVLSVSPMVITEFEFYHKETAPNVDLFENILSEIGEEFPFSDVSLFVNTHNPYANPNSMSVYMQIEHSFIISDLCTEIETSSSHMTVVAGFDGYKLRYPCERYTSEYDIVVDYSLPNINHVISTGFHSNRFLQKLLYIPPIPFAYQPIGIITMHSSNIRDIAILGLFNERTYSEGTRRKIALDELKRHGLTVTMVNNKYTSAEVEEVYGNSRIVLNIHQTHHARTIEEYRILPALLMGAVVVSEDGPYLEHIPYRDYVIFTSESDFTATVLNVSIHYAHYYNRIHGAESGLKEIVEGMMRKARVDTEQMLLRTLCSRPESSVRQSDFFGCDDFNDLTDTDVGF